MHTRGRAGKHGRTRNAGGLLALRSVLQRMLLSASVTASLLTLCSVGGERRVCRARRQAHRSSGARASQRRLAWASVDDCGVQQTANAL